MITRIIHQIWWQGWDKLPIKYEPYVQSLIDKNPGWVHKKWDEKSIREVVSKLGSEYLLKLDTLELLHQKIDFSRYLILYSEGGGVSVDTDALALKGFDETPYINTSDFIVSEKPHNKSINNATILTSKNNPIMKYVIDNIDTRPCGNYESKYKCIQRTTGPYAFDRLLRNFRGQITVLDKSYFEPCASVDNHCEIPKNSILDHRHELSWLKPSHKGVMKLYFEVKHYKYQILIGIMILILLIVIVKNNKS